MPLEAEPIPDVPTLLSSIRRRPGMWLGTKSIIGMKTMLASIRFAESFHGIPREAQFGGFDFTAFEGWVEQKYNPGRLSLDSFGLAAYLVGSDADGFDLWFQWYDAFGGDRHAEGAEGQKGRSPLPPPGAAAGSARG